MAGIFARLFDWMSKTSVTGIEVELGYQMDGTKVVTCPLHKLPATVAYTGASTPNMEGLRVMGCSIIGGVNTSIENEFACSGVCGELITDSLAVENEPKNGS